ncbi:MAG: ribonuclease HII [Candidatus Woesearchaeota archaeon]
MLICGIDEAGRGPVIGPLVICGVLVDERGNEKLKLAGVKDSKLLTKKQREAFFDKIKNIVKKFKIIEVTPQEIDLAVTGFGEKNLNFLEAKKTAEIIKNFSPDKAYIDCPSPNVKAYKDYLYGLIGAKTEIIVAHKADIKYPVVSAASIVAKVTRDRIIENLQKKYGRIGSGYPADPVTKKFLKDNFDKHPEIFRHSWATMKELKNKAKQKSLNDF